MNSAATPILVRLINGLSGAAAYLADATMEERIRFITHRDKRVLLIDLRGCTAEEVLATLPEVQKKITAEPHGSVLSLSIWSEAHISRELAEQIKRTMVFDRPHIKRTAFVGVEKVPKVFLDAFKNFSRRDFTVFSDVEQAKDWLVQD